MVSMNFSIVLSFSASLLHVLIFIVSFCLLITSLLFFSNWFVSIVRKSLWGKLHIASSRVHFIRPNGK